MSLLIIIVMPYSTNHHSKLIQLYYGYNLLMDFHYLCLLLLVYILHCFNVSILLPPLHSSPLHLSDVTQDLVVQPVSLPPRPSQLSCPRVSPVHACPPTTVSPHFVGPKSASAVGSWPAAKPWCSTETAGDTWLLLH